MKAADSQIPGTEVKEPVLTHGPSKGLDTIWAEVRRMKARLEALELAGSTARRDINRLDKKLYREEAKLPSDNHQGTQYPVGLFH